ncbi:TniQ family protein [Paenibacillus amylolyticus]|uniref:TniQ family protein n=1 Tax=Paenibacillus amylolyticus TaxID=1451 RepID=UPI0032420E46
MNDSTLTIKTRPYQGESLTAFLMRTAERNHISYQSLLQIADIKYTRSHHLDFNPKYITELDKLASLLETDKAIFQNSSFGHITEVLLDVDEQHSISYNNFFFKLFNRIYRRFCPMCLKQQNSYLLFWQINDYKVCVHHGLTLTSKCPSCQKDQPYISLSLVRLECYSCGEKLTKYNHVFQKLASEVTREQVNLNSLWNTLQNINTQLKYEKARSKSEYLALLILFICSGKREEYDHSNVEFLTLDFKCRLLSFIDRREGYKPTLHQLINLILYTNLEISNLLKIEIPTQFIESVQRYNKRFSEVPVCQSPWCPSYQTSSTMVRTKMKVFKWEGIIYSAVFMCSCCYVKFARKGNQEYREVGESYLWAWNHVLPLLRRGESETNIISDLKITRYKALKYHVYFSVQNVVDINLARNTPENPIKRPIVYFKKLNLNGNGSIIGQARIQHGWGQRVYFYYLFNQEVQLYLFDAVELERESINKVKVKNTKTRITELNPSLLPDKPILLNLINEYVQKKNELGESITDTHLYRSMNTTRKTILKYYPDLVNYVEQEKIMQKANQTRSLEDERIKRIQESFDLITTHGEYPSYERIVEISEVPKKYIRTHPRVKEVFLNLRRGYMVGEKD